jgi:transcriptional repressor NrdR
MHCPICVSTVTRVIDSRVSDDGMAIRRRRECDGCQYRFSTKEGIELLDITIVKRDGKRESYSREKLERGILRSLTKRAYTKESFEKLISSIERSIQQRKKRELTSEDLGELIMDHLKGFDQVAYIRFASIYLSFEDLSSFEDEIKRL